MCISIDFHGSLTSKYSLYPNPSIWKSIMELAMEEGIKVHVISGNWKNDLRHLLKKEGYIKGVHYYDVHSILDRLKTKGIRTWYDAGHKSWYSGKDSWWLEKAAVCNMICSKIHFDNDPRFAPAFNLSPTRFVHTVTWRGQQIIKGLHLGLSRRSVQIGVVNV
jgi:hypothetical protein